MVAGPAPFWWSVSEYKETLPMADWSTLIDDILAKLGTIETQQLANALLKAKFGSGDDDYDHVRMDPSTECLTTIGYSHHEIHAGSNFRVQANGDSISSLVIAFKTPAGNKHAHFIWEWSTESSGYIQLLEGAAWDATTGTVRAPKNSNRNSGATSMLLNDKAGAGTWVADGVLIDPDNVSGGTVISDKRDYHTATFLSTPGGGGEHREETILKADTTYALVWTTTDGPNGAQLRCEWYEHTDRNP